MRVQCLLLAALLTASAHSAPNHPKPSPSKAVTKKTQPHEKSLAERRAEVESQYARSLSEATDSEARAKAITLWWKACQPLSYSSSELAAAWKTKVEQLARVDFYAVYRSIIDLDTGRDRLKELVDTLSSEHREAIHKLATYEVDHYRDKTVPYPADVPAPGHAWGDLSRPAVAVAVAAAPTVTPLPAAWQPVYSPGQFFVNEYGQPVSVVLRVDPAKKLYLVMFRTYYPKREPYWLYAEECGHYVMQDGWVEEENIKKARPTPQKYTACELCGGAGCQYDDVTRVRGGHWEEVSSVVKVYTPAHATSSYQKKVVCRGCNGQGWIRR